MLGLEPEFEDLVDIKPGSVYNASEVNGLAKKFTDRLSALGYAFARAIPNPVVDPENPDEVSVVYTIDPGRRVYVRKVNITGNTRTQDEVIRREVRQYEASWFDSDKVAVSRDRIDRLGFFETVTAEPEPVPGSPDEVDLAVNVKERPTGNISIGAGYSTSEGIVLSGGFSQNNVSVPVILYLLKSIRLRALELMLPASRSLTSRLRVLASPSKFTIVSSTWTNSKLPMTLSTKRTVPA